MSKKFIILMSPDDKQVSDKVLAYIKENGMGWWHWLNGSYLIKTSSTTITARQMRDAFQVLLPNAIFLIFEIKEGSKMSWAGLGPKSKEKNMFDWLHKNWKDDSIL